MKIAAVIAEYNPLHNGHLYQLDAIRETVGADYIVVVMSGDFVQRGAPAIIDKYARTRAALLCGADAVFELPVYFALGSAEYFAQGAVSLLDKLGAVDVLHFGSECGDLALLCECAEMITDETPRYKDRLNFHLKTGKSFPYARSEAVKDISPLSVREKISDIFSSPNNLLALEYIKALKQRNSRIAPLTLKRAGADFHTDMLSNDSLPSANAIRKSLSGSCENDFSHLKAFVPSCTLEALAQNALLFQDDFSQTLFYKLLQTADFDGGFARFYDIGTELSNVIAANAPRFNSFEELAHLCKSKNLTYTRICRGLMHILLDMTQETADFLKSDDYCGYARLLGFRSKDGESALLRRIKKSAAVPVITAPAKGLRQLEGSALLSLKADIHAANVYECIKGQKMTQMSFLNEMTREVIKIATSTHN